jgi:amidase
MDDIAFATAVSLGQKIRAKEIGCLELLDHCLNRAERYNPELNAIVAWQVEKARDRAREADVALARGQVWGPLHGIPMTVKESFDIEGLPTTFGNPAFAKNIAKSNAALVERVLAAGAVIYGKTNVPFMLIDSQTYNDVYGTTNNPWDLKRAPGGSSGGGAVVLATGLAALEAGSDIGGSLRNPGHYTGTYGHRSTYGVVSYRGHAPPGIQTPTDMSVAGPLARDAGDLELAMKILAGADGLAANVWRVELPPPRAKELKDFRVAVWAHSPLSAVSDSIVEQLNAAAEAVRRAGAKVDAAARPDFDPAEAHAIYMKLLRAATSARAPDSVFEEQKKIAATVPPDDHSHRAATARGATLYHREWLAADEARLRFRLAWRDFFKNYDVVLAPIAATPAFLHDQNPDRDQRKMLVNGNRVAYTDQLFWAGMATMPYLPATSAPIGFVNGLPVGMQIIGAEGDDLTTIEFAKLLAAEVGGFVVPPNYSS